jgi:hypothetical protein
MFLEIAGEAGSPSHAARCSRLVTEVWNRRTSRGPWRRSTFTSMAAVLPFSLPSVLLTDLDVGQFTLAESATLAAPSFAERKRAVVLVRAWSLELS